MPYLRITCPNLPVERRRSIAERLTDSINDVFFNPRGPLTRDDLRERTTIHFVPYEDGQLFIGSQTPSERKKVDLTVEISDWSMPVRRQRKLATVMTPLLAELFAVRPEEEDGINIRFHPYPPTDFAVGGRLLSDIVPFIGRLSKRFFG